MTMTNIALEQAFANHPRIWGDFEFVYPVISRRSHGLSIGINLSPSKACNFNCVYCCVDRSQAGPSSTVRLPQLQRELSAMLEQVSSGEIWTSPEFEGIPEDYRRLRDIAFSGDGEPTVSSSFLDACQMTAQLKRAHRFFQTRMVLITNGSGLRRPAVQSALTVLDANQGDIWIKLDAGTQHYYRRINRCNTPLETIVENIVDVGTQRPVVLQTMVVRLDGSLMPPLEFAEYCATISRLKSRGVRIKQVQLYTIARKPMAQGATPATLDELTRFADAFRNAVPGVACGVYPAV